MHSAMTILAFNLFKTNGTHVLKGKGKNKVKGKITPVHSMKTEAELHSFLPMALSAD